MSRPKQKTINVSVEFLQDRQEAQKNLALAFRVLSAESRARGDTNTAERARKAARAEMSKSKRKEKIG